jgi:hypothetical protein
VQTKICCLHYHAVGTFMGTVAQLVTTSKLALPMPHLDMRWRPVHYCLATYLPARLITLLTCHISHCHITLLSALQQTPQPYALCCSGIQALAAAC